MCISEIPFLGSELQTCKVFSRALAVDKHLLWACEGGPEFRFPEPTKMSGRTRVPVNPNAVGAGTWRILELVGRHLQAQGVPCQNRVK